MIVSTVPQQIILREAGLYTLLTLLSDERQIPASMWQQMSKALDGMIAHFQAMLQNQELTTPPLLFRSPGILSTPELRDVRALPLIAGSGKPGGQATWIAANRVALHAVYEQLTSEAFKGIAPGIWAVISKCMAEVSSQLGLFERAYTPGQINDILVRRAEANVALHKRRRKAASKVKTSHAAAGKAGHHQVKSVGSKKEKAKAKSKAPVQVKRAQKKARPSKGKAAAPKTASKGKRPSQASKPLAARTSSKATTSTKRKTPAAKKAKRSTRRKHKK